MRRVVSVLAHVFPVVAIACLSGCGVAPQSDAVLGAGLTGVVHGGQQPVAGATIQLYTVGTTADRSVATPLLVGAVMTDIHGNFSITARYSCAQATQVYITATGGNPGLAVANPNLALMAALGPCSSLGPTTFLTINELTTVAAVSSLAPYMGTIGSIGSGPSDAGALAAAMSQANEYVSPATGVSPGANVPAGDSVPTALINTLGDIVAACVNSTGGTAGDTTPCGQLFALTTISGQAAPVDTVTALLNLALNPTLDTGALFNLTPASAVFQPTLAAAPPDFNVRFNLPASQQALQLSAAALTFAATDVGYPAVVQSVTVTNSSAATVTAGSVFATGSAAADFTQTSNCVGSLPAGASCAVQVTFLPVAAGSRTAYLAVDSNSPTSPQYVALAGTGISLASTYASVSANGLQLLRGGQPWIPHGVVMIAFVNPYPGPNYKPFLSAAYNNYVANKYQSGHAELDAIKAWGADSIRLQISQPYLDPASTQSGEPPYSQDLYNALADGVAYARSIGLNVILCVQDEAQSGEANYTTDPTNNPAMPNADTISVWKQLAPLYKNDKGVLLELFNEPTGPNTTANWTTWYNAMQAVVNTIRGTVGATNVIVADGVSFAQTLQGAPLLADTQTIYAAHPYFHNTTEQMQSTWITNYESFTSQAPVIVTEWAPLTQYFCNSDTAAAATGMVAFMQANNIGLEAYGYDAYEVPGGITTDFNGTVTTFAGVCTTKGWGVGQVVQNEYRQ